MVHLSKTGVMILTIPRGYQSQKMVGCFPFTHHLGGDFDGKIMRPEKGRSTLFWGVSCFEGTFLLVVAKGG